MNRWNIRNTINKRDVLMLKKELENIMLLLIDVKKMISQESANIVAEVKNECIQGRQMLQDSRKESKEVAIGIVDKMAEILQMCQNTNSKCSDVEELMKMLLMDSLMKEVNDGKAG